MYCSSCKKEININAKFCVHCGHRIDFTLGKNLLTEVDSKENFSAIITAMRIEKKLRFVVFMFLIVGVINQIFHLSNAGFVVLNVVVPLIVILYTTLFFLNKFSRIIAVILVLLYIYLSVIKLT